MAQPDIQDVELTIDAVCKQPHIGMSLDYDKEKTKMIVQDTLGNIGCDDEFSEPAFDEIFEMYDKDGSGTVEKGDLISLIKEMLGN